MIQYINFKALLFFMLVVCCRSAYILDTDDSINSYVAFGYLKPNAPLNLELNQLSDPVGGIDATIQSDVDVFLNLESQEFKLEPIQVPGKANPIYQLKDFPISNAKYQLKIKIADGTLLSAATKIPNSVPGFAHIECTDKFLTPNLVQSLKLTLKWNLDSTSENFYHLIIRKVNFKYDGAGKYIQDNVNPISQVDLVAEELETLKNVVLLTHEPGLLLAGENYPKDEINLALQVKTKLPVDPEKEIFKELQLELRAVSKEYYNFHKALALQLQNTGSGLPSLQTVSSYTNFTGGHGLFGAYRSYFDVVRFN